MGRVYHIFLPLFWIVLKQMSLFSRVRSFAINLDKIWRMIYYFLHIDEEDVIDLAADLMTLGKFQRSVSELRSFLTYFVHR